MPDKEKKEPSGGLDRTPLHPATSPTYTVRITFHGATNIPIADFRQRSSDPYLVAHLKSHRPERFSQDPTLSFRTHTVHSELNPKWESSWTVAGVLPSGFLLKVGLYDEDPEDHDDRLGKIVIPSGALKKGYNMDKREFKLRKKGASIRAYTLRWGKTLVQTHSNMHVRLMVSIEVLGQTEEEVGKAYTLDCFWWKHFSPMIGRLAGTKAQDDKEGVEKTNFQSNEFQLRGPVPTELYHRYVKFKPFIGWIFEKSGVSGWFLARAMHHQHERIYIFDPQTRHGRFDGPGHDMTSQFLDLVHYDQGGRIFTYVLTLDGMFRFTETGKEFAIDMLSKHTMHSDVQKYIAWSGEFLVRRLKHPDLGPDDPKQETHPAEPLKGGPPDEEPSIDPRHYELIIDNDSGTYRPEKSLLPVFKGFLEKNLVGLKIVAMACDDPKLDKIKKDQVKAKEKEGDHLVVGQQSDSSSISSSDVSSLADRDDSDADSVYAGTMDQGAAFLQDPKSAIKSHLPGKGKRDRETREEKGDDAAAAAPTRAEGTRQ